MPANTRAIAAGVRTRERVWGNLVRLYDPNYDRDKRKSKAYEFGQGKVKRVFHEDVTRHGLYEDE